MSSTLTRKAKATYWPDYLPTKLVRPNTTLDINLDISALRFGECTAIGFFGRDITYRELQGLAARFADWLQNDLHMQPGERIALYMQNCPHWLIAYYGALQIGAVVVPINPMNRTTELHNLLLESGATVLVCLSELSHYAIAATPGTAVTTIAVAEYADYLPANETFSLPEWLVQTRPCPIDCISWAQLMAQPTKPVKRLARSEDLALLNFTSGSTGIPKACMHTHQTFMHTTVGLNTWHGHAPGTVFLGVAPMYQVAGLVVGVNCAIYCGGTLVPMPRWDRSLAAQLIKHYQVAYAGIAPTALIDLLSAPDLVDSDLASLKRVSFGGATMPDSVWQNIHDRLGLSFIEAYGLTETAATTHINPVNHPKRQCLGIPFFDTDSRIIDPDTLQLLGPNEPGEIVINGPQVFKGYWQRPEETDEAFIEIEGQRYFRSGDIGYFDEDGYFYMTDRLKRMINASGFKVWPAEVEKIMYAYPDIQEVCVVRANDPYRGETVKAVVVLKAQQRGKVSEASVLAWAREHMAAYKYPRIIEFKDSLPKSAVGKILWKELEDEATVSQAK